MYRIDHGNESYWALDDLDREQIKKAEKKKAAKAGVQRFESLGEMMAKELWDTTLNPEGGVC
ncbi:MAG: hypothetical protein R3E66_01405 [bacterium]